MFGEVGVVKVATPPLKATVPSDALTPLAEYEKVTEPCGIAEDPFAATVAVSKTDVPYEIVVGATGELVSVVVVGTGFTVTVTAEETDPKIDEFPL